MKGKIMRGRKILLLMLAAAVLTFTGCQNETEAEKNTETDHGSEEGEEAGENGSSGEEKNLGEEGSSKEESSSKEKESSGEEKSSGEETSSGEEGSPDSDGDGKTLVVRISEDIGDLNPFRGNSSSYVLEWVYDGLTDTEDGKVVSGLAESWEISSDGLTYTFHLRSGVCFSDGSLLTAELVRKNLETVLNHREAFPYLPSVSAVGSVEAPDEQTVKINLNSPCNSLLNDLSGAYPFAMLGENGFSAEMDSYEETAEPLGTGMWELKANVEGQYALFERNEDYWGKKPVFQYLKAVVIPEITDAADALKAGEIDVILDESGEELDAALCKELEEAGFRTDKTATSVISLLSFHTGNGVTSDRNVRLAMACATDTAAVSEQVYGGLQEPADSYFSKEVPGTDIGIKPYGYDLEAANALLEEAGWHYAEETGAGEDAAEASEDTAEASEDTAGAEEDTAEFGGEEIGEGETKGIRSKEGQELAVDLVYDASIAGNQETGELLKSQYEKVGIRLNLIPMTGDAYLEAWKTGQFGVLLTRTWGVPYEPYGSFVCMASAGDKFYVAQSGISGKQELDIIMKDAVSQQDGKKLQEDMEYILDVFHDEAVYVPLTAVSRLAVYSDGPADLTVDSVREGIGLF